MKGYKIYTILKSIGFFLLIAGSIACKKEVLQPEPFQTKRVPAGVQMNLFRNSDPEAEIREIRILAFGSPGSEIEAAKDANQLHSYTEGSSTFQSMTAGKRDIYLIANEPSELSTLLESVTSASDLNNIRVPYNGNLLPPFPAVNKYANVQVGNKAGEIQKLDGKVFRSVAKLNVNIYCDYNSFNGPKPTFKSISVRKLPTSYSLMSGVPYTSDNYTHSEIINNPANTAADPNSEYTSSHVFYIPEHILAADKTDFYSYIEIIAQLGSNPNTLSIYHVPVGDAMDAFTTGSNKFDIRRNTNYAVNVRLKNVSDTDLDVEAQVSDWIEQDVKGDMEMTWLNVSSLYLPVNLLTGSSVYFASNVPIDSIRLSSGTSAFEYTEIYQNGGKKSGYVGLSIKDNMDFRGQSDTLTIYAPRIKKRIILSVLNPVAIADAQDQGPNLGLPLMNWREAMGYADTYVDENSNLKDPLQDFMNHVVPDNISGCRAYYENTPDNHISGTGKWRVLTQDELKKISNLISNTGIDNLFGSNFSDTYWSGKENEAQPSQAFIMDFSGKTLELTSKSNLHKLRCVRGAIFENETLK